MNARPLLRSALLLACAVALCALTACGDDATDADDTSTNNASTSTNNSTTSTNSGTTTAPPDGDPVTVNFAVTVDGAPFACGDTYTLGSENTPAELFDMRFYAHAIKFIKADGSAVEMYLEPSIWQTDDLVMLDFEDGCLNGTPQTNTAAQGILPAGEYTAIEFTLGVPRRLNDLGVFFDQRPSPLNITSMYWTWQAGYKFMRVDTSLESFIFHLGSTGCEADTCANLNMPTVRIDGFDPATDTVSLDLAALLSGVDISVNTESTAPGCMSAADDPECGPIFEAIGLTDAAQTAFTRVTP